MLAPRGDLSYFLCMPVNFPKMQPAFSLQIMKYAEQRIPTLNEYCVVCDEQHVFQNGSMLKVQALLCYLLPESVVEESIHTS